MRRAANIAFAAVTVLALAGGGLMLFAPQVPALWHEGFPPPVWTGEGRFALVETSRDLRGPMLSRVNGRVSRIGWEVFARVPNW